MKNLQLILYFILKDWVLSLYYQEQGIFTLVTFMHTVLDVLFSIFSQGKEKGRSKTLFIDDMIWSDRIYKKGGDKLVSLASL